MKTFESIGNALCQLKELFFGICSYAWRVLRNPTEIIYFPQWLSSNLIPGKTSVKDGEIWITFKGKRFLESILTPQMDVFEYGSGGSTIFFARRVRHLTSVEHDRDWYNTVLQNLKKRQIHNSNYLLVQPEPIDQDEYDVTHPLSYSSLEYPKMTFEKYVKSIDIYPDEYFDVVFIDGRSRPSCILHSKSKVRPGGIIVLDNSERTHYAKGIDLLIEWEGSEFSGSGPYGYGSWKTSVWRKLSP